MGETPVALDCFLRTNLWFIFEDMAGHGRDPFVLRVRRGEEKRERVGGKEGGKGGEKRREGKKGRKGERKEGGFDNHTSKGSQWPEQALIKSM